MPCVMRCELIKWSTELEADVIPIPRNKFVNTMRGSCSPEISFNDLPFEFSQVKDDDNNSEPHTCKLEDLRDKGGSKIVGEVFPIETKDINDVSPNTTQPREANHHPRSRFDMLDTASFKTVSNFYLRNGGSRN
ncbi:hypothetical protein L1987_44970 [Smallanthus sonchifolius]|uniref:Uncharacterized protein n=1 Tax=Smallanthus sonchifolius TaxID=185202 RepID=A0ACB9GQB6_9ASTR|nr:hypothetical protein L1987_44970 [Smallanthus sonchifolius]